MEVTVTISVKLDKEESLIPEARAVQHLQNMLAATANMPAEKLVEVWRKATVEKERPSRQRHPARPRSVSIQVKD